MDYSITGDIKPKLNAFNLSHNHFTTIRQGYLYPIGWFECVPSDIFDLNIQSLIRVQPLVAPILNNLTCDIHAFFVPTRLLWDKWEDFITTIDQKSIPPKSFEGLPPVWCENENVADWTLPEIELSENRAQGQNDEPKLWDYFGLSRIFKANAQKEFRPVDFLRRAYYFIWNEWFRDENLQEKIDFRYTDNGGQGNQTSSNQNVLRRAWRKDYFTAGFLSRTKGTAPSLNTSGQLTFEESPFYIPIINQSPAGASELRFVSSVNDKLYSTQGGSPQNPARLELTPKTTTTNVSIQTGISVDDLRDLFAVQRFLTRLMMSGSRYIEFLQSQFGVSPSDARLQIPERIGGTSFNINISEVIQTSNTVQDSPQGNQTGHGLSVSSGSLGNYKCEEFGFIIILANIQPPAVYTDRMPRELFRKTLLEQYNPHFVNLSFQGVTMREIYAKGTEEDDKIFNFSGRYDEMREKTSYVTGQLYDAGDGSFSLPGYIQYRSFADSPAFNDAFIEANPSKTIFSVEEEDPFICNFYLDVKALRPLPLISEPSLIDHVYGGK